ncbi:PaaI family thioesterase [Ramlibacter terrae]|uniref:PaaI family thioesterase n=1 Tax=Ramlibacter terrae TaxID=2732511 RepID=A0ABX6P889_9BURK|nr:PaaI family thioesterase [Ramlibacter terrae]
MNADGVARAPEPATSGLREHLGIRFIGMQDGAAVLALTIGPEHMNLASTLHGGAIATLVDIACALAARVPPGLPGAEPAAARRGVATLSMTLNFTRPVSAGTVRAFGRRVGGGRSIVFAACDVFDDQDRLVANGSGCYAFRS